MLRRLRQPAFTLIELLVVIAIVAILAGILFPVFVRASYWEHYGLSYGFSWPTYPRGRLQGGTRIQPIALAEVSKPSFLQMVADSASYHDGLLPPTSQAWAEGGARNICYADGHARLTRNGYFEWPVEQRPWEWNIVNPRQPVSLGKPCRPTCAEEA